MKRFVALTLVIVFAGGFMLLLAGGLFPAAAQQTQPEPKQGAGEIKSQPPSTDPGTPPAPPTDPTTPPVDKEQQREYETQC